MHIQRLTKPEDLTALADAWNTLADASPFRSWDWTEAWWRCFGDVVATGPRPAELFVLTVYDDDALVAIAPWYLDHSPGRGRVLRFLGSDPHDTICSEYLGLLCQPAAETMATRAIAEWLSVAQHQREGGNRWDLLELTEVDAEDRPVQQLAQQLAEGDCAVHRQSGRGCWRLALDESWDDYLARLSKSHRKIMRRLERRCYDTGRAVFHTVRNQDELDRAMPVLADLHQRRWQSLEEPGCFSSSRFCNFLEEVSHRLLRRDKLEFHWVELDGKPVAADFNMLGQDTVFTYQGGVDPERLHEEPGRLIVMREISRAIAQGRQAFDFLRGDLPYKAHLRATRRETCEYRIASARMSARLRHRLWITRQTAKKWVKRGLQASGALSG